MVEMLIIAQRKHLDGGYVKNMYNNGISKSTKINCVTLKYPLLNTGFASIIAEEVAKICEEERDYNSVVPVMIREQNVGNLYVFRADGEAKPGIL